ncbi:HMG domain-containing protein 3 isoform X2 [Polyodon spathula]|uniref:HMG domain-containing protein 3 isoform X2 n=1 Tax=Polyodon spathula TaxID=7913 RepID=UPI001B7F0759|nr:HMG domain-containing protein 3 isoform X2 [Polyodon spathula]
MDAEVMDAVYEGTEVKIITEEEEGCYAFMEVSSPKKKKKCKSHGESLERAKKPRSAYLLYYFDIHQSMQQEYPHLPQSEINKRISENWKRLTVADKGYYLERAKLEKQGIDPDSQVAGPSADVPGFRKILPRSNYVLIPKSTVPDGSPQVDLCLRQGGSDSEATPQTLSHDTLFSPMGLGSEVELPEHCIAIEGLTDETAAALSQSGALQEILSQFSSTTQGKEPAAFVLEEEPAVELVDGQAYGAVSVVIEETLVDGSGTVAASTTTGQQTRDEGHLVTIIPNQEAADSNVSSGSSSLILVPINTKPDASANPSFKLSIKYTRRGRGSCRTPGCLFSYVTRHKPPQCPQCGKHLGGKWLPSAGSETSGKKALAKAATTGNKVTSKKQKETSGETSRPSLETFEAVTQLIVAASSYEMNSEPQWKEVAVEETAEVVSALQSGKEETAGQIMKEPENSGTKEAVKRGNAITRKSTAGGTNCKTPTLLIHSSTAAKRLPPVTSAPNPRSKGREKPAVVAPKRPVRAILPAPTQSRLELGAAYVQWVAVPPNKLEDFEMPKNNSKPAKRSCVKVSGLKPNTLKHLGHPVKQVVEEQAVPSLTNTNQNALSEKGVKILSILSYKHNPSTSLDLGLSTARGRGKCKNPSCDYVYKNRHKPLVCPSCGWDLTKDKQGKKPKLFENMSIPAPALLDPYQPLSAAQQEVQRQSTLQLLRKTVLIPESEGELAEAMALIQELNGTQVVLSMGNEETIAIEQTGWPRYYESAATQCVLCDFPLFKGGQSSIAGQEDCWLLTDSHIQTATVQLKICLNPQCLALHSFNDMHMGLFNVGNKLLVSLDLFFKIRNQIKLGHNPKDAALHILDTVQSQPVNTLNPSELSQIQELLCNGYWAFECFTVRDYNDMICGVCGIAPKLEIAQRNTENVLHLKNVQFTWPDFLAPDEVNVDDFWSTMEGEAIEQAAFPSSMPVIKFDASIIAPFFPPLMRNSVVVNTEKDKYSCEQTVKGDIGDLVRLIHAGTFKPDQINSYSEKELRDILNCCDIPHRPEDTQEQMRVSLLGLYAYIQNGTAKQHPSDVTGGKLYKVCPHQVVCGSKYIVRGESARDHVDLLVSSRYWPPVYAVDMAKQVAVSTDIWYPELAAQMWGKNQGCFSDPMELPEYVSCIELQDQQYNMDLTVPENSIVHPITKSPSRWIVCSEVDQEDSGDPLSQHHSLSLCRELEPYSSIISTIQDSKTSNVRQQPFSFDNAAYYYLYNRLIDFLTSKDIVNNQIADILQTCQPGEVVIRDSLYRLGVAQINTEVEPEEVEVEQQ